MALLQGNLQGLKASQIKALERLSRRRFPAGQLYGAEQAKELALLSAAINRQIGIFLDRKSKPQLILVGQANSIYIPEIPNLAPGRMRGWHFLHTHLDAAGLSQEDLMDMLFLRLDAMLCITVDPNGLPCQWQGAWLLPPNPPQSLLAIPGRQAAAGCYLANSRPWHDLHFDVGSLAREIETAYASCDLTDGSSTDRAILVSVKAAPLVEQEAHLAELAELARSAGLTVTGQLTQRITSPHPRFILGKGKLRELEALALDARAELLIFDGELTPGQLNSIAELTERKVIDRTQLILDIFAQSAQSASGKLQVELAQLAYAQPRLTGQGKALDRLMGGIGGRGPGESKLETDKRRIRERMASLKRELKKLKSQRSLGRARREARGIPVAALIGYTNSGKSTLLNTLTNSNVKTENKMFATLDPVTRRLRFPKQREITVSDTVGFIRNLPKELWEAFRATLEELHAADLLIHVADASSPGLDRQLADVEAILEELELRNDPMILVLNKCDLLDANTVDSLKLAYPDAILVSGLTAVGLDTLLNRLDLALFGHAGKLDSITHGGVSQKTRNVNYMEEL